jgi:hypothetical protein
MAEEDRIMKKALKQLINTLDKVFEEHEEVGPQPGYELPAEFGIFSDEGDRKVRAALKKFLTHPELAAAATRLKTPKERLDAFQDNDVESSEGNTYDEYFGYAESPGIGPLHGP